MLRSSARSQCEEGGEQHESGDHYKAAHHAHVAQGHHVYATEHAEQAAKHHSDAHGAAWGTSLFIHGLAGQMARPCFGKCDFPRGVCTRYQITLFLAGAVADSDPSPIADVVFVTFQRRLIASAKQIAAKGLKLTRWNVDGYLRVPVEL